MNNNENNEMFLFNCQRSTFFHLYVFISFTTLLICHHKYTVCTDNLESWVQQEKYDTIILAYYVNIKDKYPAMYVTN